MIIVHRMHEVRNSGVVPITVAWAGAAYRFVHIYTLPIPDLQVGDIVDLRALWSVTNDVGYNVMVGSAITATRTRPDSSSPTLDGSLDDGQAVTNNLSPTEHHQSLERTAVLQVTEACPWHFNLVLYARAFPGSVWNDSHALRVDDKPGTRYGRLTAVVHRKP